MRVVVLAAERLDFTFVQVPFVFPFFFSTESADVLTNIKYARVLRALHE